MQKAVKDFQEHYGLDDLISREMLPPLAPDDITVPRLQERASVDRKTAKRWLVKWSAEGRVEYLGERRTERGATVQAWRCK